MKNRELKSWDLKSREPKNRDLRHLLKEPEDNPIDLNRGAPPLMPLLRKFHIFPQKGGNYACGFCKRTYRTSDFAWMCVASCSEPVLQNLRVATRVSGVVTYYFCPVCLKQYLNKEDASNCLENCTDHVMGLLPSEAVRLALLSAYTAEENENQTRSARDLDRVERERLEQVTAPFDAHVVNFQKSELSDDELNALVPVLATAGTLEDLDFADDSDAGNATPEVSATEPEVVPAEPEGEPTKPEVAIEVESAPEAPPPSNEIRIKWKPGLKPFRRQEAKYECTGCGVRYFSRVEVEACFNSHPIDYPKDDDEDDANDKNKDGAKGDSAKKR